MPKASRPLIASRNKPRQARSAQLVQDILEAAIRVLTREGARRFTTVRVAEEAGVSVGSLYQYFPNKEALLFRLQADEWIETRIIMDSIFGDARLSPPDRLRRATLTFFRSELEEAPVRGALDDAGALFRDAPEAHELKATAMRSVFAFMEEALPSASPKERAFAAEFVMTNMAAVAERITKQGLSRAEVDAWAKTSAEMYCMYLENLEKAAQKKRAARAAERS
ncbi:TetR family transcriptional regulator [Pendulispora albinea]|uniref:TetR family transcriptional regulator n=1 Tax=Pendulispora albinea TaxID=2741071 RepID=A0ABZ2LJT0_9BACT